MSFKPLSREFLLQRGFCCKNSCLNCPYKNKNMENNLGGWAIGKNTYNWILKNIPKGSKILELGSGSGSHELGKLYNIHCIEHNKQWLNKYDNITYYYAPIVDGWYDTSFFKTIPNDYKLLIIDGPPKNIGRGKILEHLSKFNTNVPIILDDTERKDEKELFNKLLQILKKEFIIIEEEKKSCSIINSI